MAKTNALTDEDRASTDPVVTDEDRARQNEAASGTRLTRRIAYPDVANIQVLVAKEGDRVPHMLSGQRPVEEQLEQLVQEHGEKHVTINGMPYASFADEYDLERRGDTELPLPAGMGVPQRHDPDEALEANREAGIRNAEDHVGTILPVAGMDPTGALADEARRRQAEDATLQKALKEDDERKKTAQTEADKNAANQLSKQQAEQAGMGTGGSGSGPDMREAANLQEEKSDSELEQLIKNAEAKGDTQSVAEIRRYQAMTNEDRRRNTPIVEPNGRVRVATRDVNKLANDPPAPPQRNRMARDLAKPVNSRSKPPVGQTANPEESRDVKEMSVSDLREELRRHGYGFDDRAPREKLEHQVQEGRAKRQPK